MRLCHRCSKPTTHFYKSKPRWYLEDKKSLCGLCYQKKNKSKVLASAKKYRETHKEIIKEKGQIYDKTPQGKARQKLWRSKNPEKVKKAQAKNYKTIVQGIRFRGVQIALGYDPRKGICTECHKSISKGEIKTTNLHHEKYDPLNPLDNTIELCVACHNKKEPRLRNKLGQWNSTKTIKIKCWADDINGNRVEWDQDIPIIISH